MSEKNVLEVKNLSIAFEDHEKNNIQILDNINFSIKQGEFVLICGSSGSGKTTLATCLNGIIPSLVNCSYAGEVVVDGVTTFDHEMSELSSKIGLVFQNPEDQIFSIRVCDEVAFGVECQGYKHDEIVRRVKYALEKLRIEEIENQITFTLSGGQKQKVSIASNLAILPSVIVLDDPTTDLDPVSKKEVMDILTALKQEVDTTFIVIEHDLTDLVEIADRVLVMHQGKLLFNGTPQDIFCNHYEELESIGVRIPDQLRIMNLLHEKNAISTCDNTLSVATVEGILKDLLKEDKIHFSPYPKLPPKESDTIVKVDHVSFTYPGNKTPTLKNINFEIKKGELFGIVGHNGSGKSTLMQNILGIFKPTEGNIWVDGKNTKDIDLSSLIRDIGYCFQNPDNQLFCNSVREEIEFGMRKKKMDEEKIKEETERALEIVKLKAKEQMHPFSLSRGERQRLAVATMLVEHPKIIMLDEPTTGLDDQNLKSLLQLMSDIIKEYDGTLIMVTHDMEVVSDYVERLIVIDHGEVKLQGETYDVFSEHFHELIDLKLKPTTIGLITNHLKDHHVDYLPNWRSFQDSIHFH